ncbi:putative membrane protein [Agromyces hippuratus]|uniref:Putative membrane protein n=1 Tax=Agromyces hippuratus TaxID=286438 RepID=A0A852WYQ5_9MICO|nr:DUF1304 family protein [Agromyces hippuratus]NYG21370.1 putative membrane protein [Agromyces hippuratus]
MNIVAKILAVLEGLTLITVGVLESSFYRNPAFHSIFLIEPDEYDAVQLWVVNVGWYNIFIGLGVIFGVILASTGRVAAGRAIVLFGSAMHVLLGITLLITEPALWANALGEAGLALAVILAIVIGDRMSRRDAAPATG